MWPIRLKLSDKKVILFLTLPLKSQDFMRMEMNVYNLFSKRPLTGSWCSILQTSLSPTGGARHAHGEVHSAGGTSRIRGEGEEVSQRCVYTTHRSNTHNNPVVGLPHQTPDIHQCLVASLVRLVRTWILPSFVEKFSPKNSFFDCKSSKIRMGWQDTTHRSNTRNNPVVGLPHHTPDIHQCLVASLVRLVRTWILPSFVEKFSPRNSFFDCKSAKIRMGWQDPKRVFCARYLIVAKNKDYNYKTGFLLQYIISSHNGISPKHTRKTCLCGFCVETRSINFSPVSID